MGFNLSSFSTNNSSFMLQCIRKKVLQRIQAKKPMYLIIEGKKSCGKTSFLENLLKTDNTAYNLIEFSNEHALKVNIRQPSGDFLLVSHPVFLRQKESTLKKILQTYNKQVIVFEINSGDFLPSFIKKKAVLIKIKNQPFRNENNVKSLQQEVDSDEDNSEKNDTTILDVLQDLLLVYKNKNEFVRAGYNQGNLFIHHGKRYESKFVVYKSNQHISNSLFDSLFEKYEPMLEQSFPQISMVQLDELEIDSYMKIILIIISIFLCKEGNDIDLLISELSNFNIIMKKQEFDLNKKIRNDFIDLVLERISNEEIEEFEENSIYSSSDFNVSTEVLNDFQRILSASLVPKSLPVVIVVRGKPQIGKSSFIKSFLVEQKVSWMEFSNKDTISISRILAELTRRIPPICQPNVFIYNHVDPSMCILNCENLVGLNIFKLNDNEELPESVRNIVAMEIELKGFSDDYIHNLIETTITERNLSFTDDEKTNIFSSIRRKNIALTKQEIQILINNYNLVKRNQNKGFKTFVNNSYQLAAINSSVKAEELVEMIQNAQSQKNSIGGIKILLYGLSGTGKTEFCRFVASHLGKNITLLSGSSILRSEVGHSEQIIRDSFSRAAYSGDILLLDECDQFLFNRSQFSKQQWELSLANEFLSQIQEFDGIIMCTTNLKEVLDPAINRRFHFLVEFKPLTIEGIRMLLKSYFEEISFDEKLIQSLSEYNTITAGDFGILYQSCRFKSSETVNADYIFQELCERQKDKLDNETKSSCRIGFSC